MEPSAVFIPFGREGPRVVLCGTSTGDWNASSLQKKGDQNKRPGLLFRLNKLAGDHHFSDVFMPTPTDCNCRICYPWDFHEKIQAGIGQVVLSRGVKADGVVLPPRTAGAIASADCPAIVAYCRVTKSAILAHGGCKSLLDLDHLLDKKPPRKVESVVDAVLEETKKWGFRRTEVFITCGISGKHYIFPKLVAHVRAFFGEDCVSGEGIDLKKIAARQFLKMGIYATTDTIDTYGDKDLDGRRYAWHSYRRAVVTLAKDEAHAARLAAEKLKRNLVLVVN